MVKLVRPNQYDRNRDDGAGYLYAYDLQGRIRGITGPDGNLLQKNTYDRAGQLIRQVDSTGSGIEYTYNPAGDRVFFKTTGGSTQEIEYDAQGNIVGVKDGNGNRTTYEPDAWGRTAGITKPDGSTEAYLYDHAGNMTSSTDGEGNTTLYAYDLAGNMVSITDPTGETERYAYDREGNVVEKTDRNGVTTQYAFNMYGAPLYRRVKDGALEESYRYTPEGRLESALSAGMRYSYEYDAMGRISRKSASGRTLLAYEYDLNGNLTRQTDVTGKTTEYNYNSLDFIEKVADNGTVTAEYSYYPDGSIRSLKNGSLYTEYAYDADRNLSHLKTMLGTEVLADSHYTYDPNGNRTEKRQINGTTRYAYDALNQLTKVQYPSYTEELYCDKAGNRTKRMAKGVEELYQYDPRNRLTGYTKGGVTTQFTYDKAGNLLKDNKAEYTYDAFNRTEKVETFDGHVQINRYDAEGLRHEMEEDGKLVQFIFRGDEIVTEETENKVIRFIRGYDLIASDAESARTYYHYASDEMSSITHVVTGEDKECREEAQQNPRTASSDKTDAVVLNRYEYDAWGNTTVCEETVENRFKFNGQQLDPATQQYYLRTRFYNPVIARFTQEDTYRGDGLNLYAYCANNPVYYVDPSGHVADCMKEAFRDARKRGMSVEDAYQYALKKRQTNRVNKAIDAIIQYQNESGTILTQDQQRAFLLDAMEGYTISNIVYNKKNNKVLQSNPNFKGMQMLISHDGNNKIIHHAATITSETKKMGGTKPSDMARNWVKNITGGNSPKMDYGHIVTRQSGGSGNLSDLNGFAQDVHINRGDFSTFQSQINSKVNATNNASTFVTFSYGASGSIPIGINYDVTFTNGSRMTKDFSN